MQFATRDGYTISTDRARLDRDTIHAFLRESYWSPGVARATVDAAIEHSLCFGLFAPDGAQAGFARAITDHATFGYLADVFVLEAHRGRGLGIWLVQTALGHASLQGLRQVLLRTADAHGLYRRFGFEPLSDPERTMVRRGSV